MAQDESKAFATALRRLNAREYSRAEMQDYLMRKGFEKSDAAEAVARLVENRYLDDARYARAVIRYQASRGKGPTYIRMRLKAKGIDLSTTELRELLFETSGKPELELARELVDRRFPGARRDRLKAAKAVQALLRRGFSYEIARQAVGRLGDSG